MTGMLIPRLDDFEAIRAAFRWRVPARFNMAWAVCDRHAEASDALALIHERAGREERWSFRDLRAAANRLANAFGAMGLAPGDRVAIHLGQSPETAIAHLACWKAGLVSVPCSTLFGADALDHRLRAARARAVVAEGEGLAAAEALRGGLEQDCALIGLDGPRPGVLGFAETLARASDRYRTLDLPAEAPAMINFTSGTTGWPKAALHAHRVLLGQMPGLELCYDFLPRGDDVLWSPADWSWVAGLFDVLMPAWFHGRPVVTQRAGRFDAEEAFRTLGRHGVTASLLTPTMLKMMRQVPHPGRFDLRLRAVLSGSEAVGAEILDWAARALGADVNEAFGQTECNVVIGNCARVLTPRPGALGKPLPGHEAEIVNDAGERCADGEEGHIAIRRPDPAMLLEYLDDPEATAARFIGDWMITGDLGRRDEAGYLWHRGRADDVITSAGYRIGPSEIEDALAKHPAVAMAAAIGVPDAERTERIKAFVVLAEGRAASSELAEEIRATVRERLARHETPREIEFLPELPLTATGKILRRELRAREARASAQADPTPPPA